MWGRQMAERRKNPLDVAIVKAMGCVAGVVTGKRVLEGRLPWAVGGSLDPVGVLKNLPTCPQVGAGIEQRFRIDFAPFCLVGADLHQAEIDINPIALEVTELCERLLGIRGLAFEDERSGGKMPSFE